MIVLIVEEKKLFILNKKRYNITQEVDFVDEINLSNLTILTNSTTLSRLRYWFRLLKSMNTRYFLCNFERNTIFFMSFFWTFSKLFVRAWDAFWVFMCFSHLRNFFTLSKTRSFLFFRSKYTLSRISFFFRKINLLLTTFSQKLFWTISHEILRKLLCLITLALL